MKAPLYEDRHVGGGIKLDRGGNIGSEASRFEFPARNATVNGPAQGDRMRGEQEGSRPCLSAHSILETGSGGRGEDRAGPKLVFEAGTKGVSVVPEFTGRDEDRTLVSVQRDVQMAGRSRRVAKIANDNGDSP